MNAGLLIELLTEELPPKSLRGLAIAFHGAVTAGLAERLFIPSAPAADDVELLATPRRLAVFVPDVLAVQPDQQVERKGPYVAAGLDPAGKPTKALLGFARSCGAEAGALARNHDAKGEYFMFRTEQKGESLDLHLSAIVQQALRRLPTPKLMRWGDGDVEFIRPAHGLIMLHGDRVVPGEVLGLSSGRRTLGHRFLADSAVTVPSATAYKDVLRDQGRVIVSFAERREVIAQQLRAAARTEDASLMEDAALLDEVTALVEFPAVYVGRFDGEFLGVPQECLILSMKQHQKYFPLFDHHDRLLPRFLVVSNIATDSPRHIVHGNERVLKARLSDAKFFYDQDRKVRLADRVPRLANVVYHNRLGSQLERVQRIRKLAGEIAGLLGADTADAERAAYLCKADLLTDMVGEFPELQGAMGQYYACHDGESGGVCEAIEAHYHPRHAGDSLPSSLVGASVALADKLDTLVGIYGIGLVPTGEKDPFGLRRQALGVVRILAEMSLPLDVVELLTRARAHFPGDTVAESVAQDLYAFVLDRLRPYLRERGFLHDEIEAVLAFDPERFEGGLTRLNEVLPRLGALQEFRRLPEAAALAAANKRIRNILRQAGDVRSRPVIDGALLREGAEKDLARKLIEVEEAVAPLLRGADYVDAMKQLARLRDTVDNFFDRVMVMVDDPELRSARLSLLSKVRQLFLRAADISKLQIEK